MAAEPDQRLSRKPSSAKKAPAGSGLVDPETVVRVSRATAKTIHTIVRVSGTVARFTARHSIAAARWTWPRLRRIAIASARTSWRAIAATGGWLWTRKRGVAGLGHRLLWWAALAILVLVGRAMLTVDGDPELVEAALMWFAVGLSMSVLVLLGAPEKRMRLAAFALASGHGSLAALAWIACV